MAMKLSLGPVSYLWSREKLLSFYDEVVGWPVDIVYLGENVCSKRRPLRGTEWLDLADRLAAAGKEVVLSTLALIEAESELLALRRIANNGRLAVEANDTSALGLLAGKTRFVAGPHVNAYNSQVLGILQESGAYRWVVPPELSGEVIRGILADRPEGLEVEIIAAGRLPLALSARCFTARARKRSKDECELVCGEYPEGLPLSTQEGEHFLTLNGIQIQSAGSVNLAGEFEALSTMGVDVLRISPVAEGTGQAVEIFRELVSGEADAADAARRLGECLPGPISNGYFRGEAGMAWREELLGDR